MTTSDSDCKLLWGRAAGFCSYPGCAGDLTIMLSNFVGFNVGEMAHVIAHSPGGPRGRPGGGSDNYGNLILLCPTCHRTVDKAPSGMFTEAMLLDWKAKHEKKRRQIGSEVVFETIDQLKASVSRRLQENRQVWTTFGPNSAIAQSDPGSNLSQVWTLRKLSTIIPNNLNIINEVSANLALLSAKAYSTFLLFKDHAISFERNQYQRLDAYPLFPVSFEEEFKVCAMDIMTGMSISAESRS